MTINIRLIILLLIVLVFINLVLAYLYLKKAPLIFNRNNPFYKASTSENAILINEEVGLSKDPKTNYLIGTGSIIKKEGETITVKFLNGEEETILFNSQHTILTSSSGKNFKGKEKIEEFQNIRTESKVWVAYNPENNLIIFMNIFN